MSEVKYNLPLQDKMRIFINFVALMRSVGIDLSVGYTIDFIAGPAIFFDPGYLTSDQKHAICRYTNDVFSKYTGYDTSIDIDDTYSIHVFDQEPLSYILGSMETEGMEFLTIPQYLKKYLEVEDIPKGIKKLFQIQIDLILSGVL